MNAIKISRAFIVQVIASISFFTGISFEEYRFRPRKVDNTSSLLIHRKKSRNYSIKCELKRN